MKSKIIPIVSVLVGILAFILTFQYLKGERRKLAEKEAEIYRGAERVRVIAAAADIPGGTVIKKSDLGAIEVFKRSVGGHVVVPDEAELLLGRKTLFTIKAREPIFWSYIEGGALSGIGLAPTIKPGMRAVSLSVAGAAAVSGLVLPNDRVDVLGTFAFPSPKAAGELETVTLTALQDVTVLATGQQMARDIGGPRGASRSSGYSTVTLEVTPREAEVLVFAEQMKGRLSLTLRHPSDVSFETDLPEINFEHLEKRLPDLNLYRQRNIRHKKDL